MSRICLAAFLAVLLAIAGRPVQAHHAMDPSKGSPIELQGVIDYVSWDGAHVMYRVRAKDESGAEKLWLVLGASPRVLATRHIQKSTIKPGQQVTVTGSYNPYSKEIAPYVMTTSDGHQYELGFYPPATTPKK